MKLSDYLEDGEESTVNVKAELVEQGTGMVLKSSPIVSATLSSNKLHIPSIRIPVSNCTGVVDKVRYREMSKGYVIGTVQLGMTLNTSTFRLGYATMDVSGIPI